MEAANENMVDLQQTIGKFRELVRQLQVCVASWVCSPFMSVA